MGNLEIVINPTYEHLRTWIESLPVTFFSEGTVIYDARNQIRLIKAPDGHTFCVKRYHKPAFCNQVIYTYIRSPKASRAYNNAVKLKEVGIETPEPIAYILMGNKLLQESYLITLASVLQRNFYEFRHHPLDSDEDVVRALGQLAARMHEQGILHLDFSPGNILFDRVNGGIHIELVDINRMRFSNKPISLKEGCYSFRRLWGQEDFFRTLASEYARHRHADTEYITQLTIKYWKQFWKHRK